MLGAFFALLAAATFGLNNASVRRGVLTGSVFQALVVTISLGVVMFLLAGLVSGSLATIRSLSSTQLLLFISAGIIHFIGGRYRN
jgi:hypothetical protein